MNRRLPAITPIGNPPPTTLPYDAEVGLDAEQALGAARMRAEAGDDLVEDQHGARAARSASRSSRRNSTGWKSGRRLCTGSTTIAASVSARCAQDLERLGRAVVEHEHVLRRLGQDAGRRRDAS